MRRRRTHSLFFHFASLRLSLTSLFLFYWISLGLCWKNPYARKYCKNTTKAENVESCFLWLPNWKINCTLNQTFLPCSDDIYFSFLVLFPQCLLEKLFSLAADIKQQMHFCSFLIDSKCLVGQTCQTDIERTRNTQLSMKNRDVFSC